QLHFGAGAQFAPQIEPGADLNGALTHTGQSPVSHAAAAQVLRVDAPAVVPDTHAKFACPIGDFRLDAIGLCVTERIAERFPRNAVDVVADNRMQVTRRALDGHPEHGGALLAIAGVELFGERSNRLRQFVAYDDGGTQILNRVAAFGDGLIGPV